MQHHPPLENELDNSSSLAPPPFIVDGNLATPIKATALNLTFDLNAAQQRGSGRGLLHFFVTQTGRPLLDLVPRPSGLILNGESLPPERLRLVTPPGDSTPLRMLDEELDAGAMHEFHIEYPLSSATVKFGDGGARLYEGHTKIWI